MKNVQVARPLLPHVWGALCIIILQCGALLWLVESRATILREGQSVLLRTAPVDPRDLMRGDYVVLNYEISQVSQDLMVGDIPDDGGLHPLHVVLAADDQGHGQVVRASFAPLAVGEGEMVLRSKPVQPLDRPSRGTATYTVDYGIERYYVPEGEGLALEALRDQSRIDVVARISRHGVAQISALQVDGEAIYSEPLY
jgi:uncharacterized membrane-anchored protein